MEYKALDREVLAVAVEGAIGDWAAYIGSVPGKNHEEEAEYVEQYGTKLHPDFAKILFPEWKNKRYRL